MPILRNVNPTSPVDLPLIGRQGDNGDYAEPDRDGYAERSPVHGSGCLEFGEEFEVTTEQARVLLAQTGNYEPVDAEALAIAEQLTTEQAAEDEKPSAAADSVPLTPPLTTDTSSAAVPPPATTDPTEVQQ